MGVFVGQGDGVVGLGWRALRGVLACFVIWNGATI